MKRILFLLLVAAPAMMLAADLTAQKNRAKELFSQRDNKEKLNECIKLLEEITSANKDYESFVLLSRSYYLLGEYTDNADEKLPIHEKGIKAGENALNTVEKFAKAQKKKKAEAEAVKTITKENMDALYWLAANQARWAKFASFTKKLSVKARIRYLWDKVHELDQNYFYGGSNRFFGGYFALVPTITGENDPVKAKEHFDKAIAAAPEYIETKVLFAEAYCAHGKVKDRELFKKTLNEVLAFDISKHPELLAENKLAQEKAKKLLAQEAELFE